MAKLSKILTIEKIMRLESGMCIGGTDDEIRIGDIDKDVVRDPLTGEPIIPGSSFKGAMRSALETCLGKDAVCTCGEESCLVCTIFGKGAKKETEPKRQITRLIVPDAYLTRESSEMLKQFLPMGTEIKTENTIDRVQGKSVNKRTFTRVPRGVEFRVQLVLQVFEGDNEEEFKKCVEFALKLLEHRYIGGSGSRGYGRIKFRDAKESEFTFDVQKELQELVEKQKATAEANSP